MNMLITQCGYPAVNVNGRKRFVHRITALRKISPSRYEGIAQGAKFAIEGGRHGGGTRRDWFLDWDTVFNSTLHCTSIADAINVIETC